MVKLNDIVLSRKGVVMNWDIFYSFSEELSDCVCVLRRNEVVYENKSFKKIFSGQNKKQIIEYFVKESPGLKTHVNDKKNLTQVVWGRKNVGEFNIYKGVVQNLDFHQDLEESLEVYLHNLEEKEDLLSAFSAMAKAFMQKYGFYAVQGLSLSRQYLWPHFLVKENQVLTLDAKDKKFREALKNELENHPPGNVVNLKNPSFGYLCTEALGMVRDDVTVYAFMIKASHTYCFLVYSFEPYSPVKAKQTADFSSVLKAYGQCMEGFFKAKRTEARKSDFIAVLNHELRTPLNGILGYGQLLEELLDDLELKDSAHCIVLSGKRLLQLFENLILFQELRLSGYIIRRDIFHMADVTKRLGSEFQSKADEKKLLFEITDEVGGRPFEGDSRLLHHLFWNLIENAIKFTSKGQVSVHFRYDEVQGAILFQVKDTGAGFSVERRQEITRDFRQLDNTMTRSYEGIGLGLSIVKEILALLSGEFFVESKVGEGTKIDLKIPMQVYK